MYKRSLYILLLIYMLICKNCVSAEQVKGFEGLSSPERIKLQNSQSINKLRIKRDSNWSIINEEVDSVVPLVLAHLHKMKVEQFTLPNIKQRFSFASLTTNQSTFRVRFYIKTLFQMPLIAAHDAVLYLTNGVVYNLAGIKRYGPAYMTYENKSFLIRFYLDVKNLQFEYNFLLKLLVIEGYGKIIGSMEDTIIYLDLGVDVTNFSISVYDFRLIQFQNLQVQLDETRFIRDLSGIILTPITNLFKQRVTTSISNNLKDQFQMVIDDFNSGDPLELRKFTRAVLGGLMQGAKSETEQSEIRESK